MKNIIYSTTRQWNCGDEFILLGCINLLKKVLGKHNPIIYNRNPDIRPEYGKDVYYRTNKLPKNFSSYKNIIKNTAKYRYGFHDNSIKFDTDVSYANLAVFAGSPEWQSSRCINFFQHILKNNLPVLILGVGSISEKMPAYMQEVISKNLMFTVRDENLTKTNLAKKYNAIYLPCPALFSVPLGEEKTIETVNSIAMVYQTNLKNSVRHNCTDDNTHEFCIELYKTIINKFKNYKISIICHYIDEIAAAHQYFNNDNVEILYSYDSKDYIDIYKEFDLIISPRVHGCGLSSSLGIPSFIIKHDERGNTGNGFCAEEIKITDNIDEVINKIEIQISNIKSKNNKLIERKRAVFEEYCSRLTVNLEKSRPEYVYKHQCLQLGKKLNIFKNINTKYILYRILSTITFAKLKKICKEREYMYKQIKDK